MLDVGPETMVRQLQRWLGYAYMNAFLRRYSIKGGCFSFSNGTLLHSASQCEAVHENLWIAYRNWHTGCIICKKEGDEKCFRWHKVRASLIEVQRNEYSRTKRYCSEQYWDVNNLGSHWISLYGQKTTTN